MAKMEKQIKQCLCKLYKLDIYKRRGNGKDGKTD